MDKHKSQNAVQATLAVLVISASLLLVVTGLSAYVSTAAQAHVASGTDLGDARLSDGMTPAK